MTILYNEIIVYQIIGAMFSIILTVAIVFIKNDIVRNKRKSYYEGINNNSNVLGDIEIKLDEELPRENFFKLMILYSIQPLLLLVLVNFTETHNSFFKITLLFGLIIFTILHEFWSGEKFSDNPLYKFIIIVCWLISFLIMSYDKNMSNLKQADNSITSKTL